MVAKNAAVAALLFGIHFGGIPSLQAAVLVHEGFDYDPGNLAGQNGGTGDWGSAWTVGFDPDGDNGTVSAGSLSGNLATSGNKATFPSANARYYRTLDTSYGADGTTLYLSFLFQADGNAGEDTQPPFYALELWTGATGTGSQIFQAGIIRNNGTKNGNFEVRAGNAGSGDLAAFDTSPHLFVARFDFVSGTDTVNVFFDPGAGTDMTGVGDATITGQNISFQSVALAHFAGPAYASSFDEITLSDTPPTIIPEPGALALLAFGGGLLAAARRMRLNRARRSFEQKPEFGE
jgi:hypothetical protein